MYVITQNVDDLHERAGSTHVVHLHGELIEGEVDSPSRACIYPFARQPRHLGRHPRRVWRSGAPAYSVFEEAVPMMEPAARIASTADIFVVIGTSLNVYPAASLMQYVRPGVPV